MIPVKVLKSLPWDKVDIEVMLIELHMAGKVFPGTRHEVHLFLDDKGYDYCGTVGRWNKSLSYQIMHFSSSGVDDIFIQKSLSQDIYKFDRQKALEFETYSFEHFYNKDEL